MTQSFTASIEIDATPSVVFEYFISPELFVSWIGDYAVLDAQPGGEFTLDIQGIPVRGEFIEVTAPERVVVSWGHAGSDTFPPASTEVTFTLEPTASGTLVTVEHTNLPIDQVENHKAGWPMFLGQLADVAPRD